MSSTLKSPGVQVTVTDESVYQTAPTGTVPLIIVATAENKLNPSGITAPYSTNANAGIVWLETSQRSLINDFGAPTFLNVQGTPVNGSELNEYGLQTALSSLSISDACYVLRAPIDLNSLTGSLTAPTAAPANGVVWLDSVDSSFGIQQYNAASQSFTSVLPTNNSGSGKLFVITDKTQTSDGAFSVPVNTLGKSGDYAIVLTNVNNPVWFMNSVGTWVEVGTNLWQSSIPAVCGTVVSPTAVTGNLVLNGTSVTLTSANLSVIVTDINAANITGVTAGAVSNRLALYVNSSATNSDLIISNVSTALVQVGLTAATYNPPQFQASPYTNVPHWNSTSATPAPTGSIWYNTSPYQSGANIVVKTYNTSTNAWVPQVATTGTSDASIIYSLDPINGGLSIPTGTYAWELESQYFTDQLLVRQAGPTTVTGTIANVAFTGSAPFTFNINASIPGSSAVTGNVLVSFNGNTASSLVNAVNSLGLVGVSASVTSGNFVQLQHSFGGTFFLYDGANTPLAEAGIATGKISNWIAPTYVVNASAPTADPAAGTLWFYDDPTVADIMINVGTGWAGYRTVSNVAEARGYNLTLTDVNGPTVSAYTPATQSTGNGLVAGDIWINTSDMTNLPNINRYNGSSWVQINNEDHTSINGIVFADARWSNTGTIDPATGVMTPITTLLNSSYLDSDAPSYTLYPRGTLLFNTRRSGMNVKKFATNYLTGSSVTSTWVTASGNDELGVAYQGSAAQRKIVVEAMISAVEANEQLVDSAYNYNLISAPGYPELIPALVTLNESRGETAFIVADAPMTLKPNSTDLNNWASNANNSVTDDVNGLVTYNDYLAVYYGSGLTTDLSGNNIVLPASYMALPTIIQADAISYPWMAPAGERRGAVTNVSSLGYIDASGDFITNSVSKSLRDILYPLSVNPISNIQGSGIQLYGQKTRAALVNGSPSELNRINVARLVIYLRNILDQIGASFTFEQNDSITRKNFGYKLGQLMITLQSQRAINDWAVDVSLDINTPAVIDANEMYGAVAIAPTTSAEFIYIPVTVYSSAANLGGGSLSL